MPMRKKIIVLSLVFYSTINAFAQKNIYDNIDTSITTTSIDTNIVEPYEKDTYTDEAIKKEKKYLHGWGDNVLGDTSINFRTVNITQDSITNWKQKNKYAWIKIIDSALHAAHNKDTNKQQQPIKDYDNSPSAIDSFLQSSFLQLFLWIIALGFVSFIIYQLFLSKGVFGKASKKASKITIEEDVVEDNLDNDFDNLYNKAFAAGNTRLAMHYLFLKTLQKLNEKELIHFTADKTNSMYATEIPSAKRNGFAQIALYYEYIWYGNVNVPTPTFNSIKNNVDKFINSI